MAVHPPGDADSPLGKMGTPEERRVVAVEPAWGKAAMFFRTGVRLGHASGSMRMRSLPEVARFLSVYRTRYEAGDTMALLYAVGECAQENLPLPEWLAIAFQERLDFFGKPGAAASLDEVFCDAEGAARTPKKAAQARLDWQLGGEIWGDLWDLVNADASITSFDMAITATLKAKKYGVGKTKAKQLVLMVEDSQAQFVGRVETLPRILEKRRKGVT